MIYLIHIIYSSPVNGQGQNFPVIFPHRQAAPEWSTCTTGHATLMYNPAFTCPCLYLSTTILLL